MDAAPSHNTDNFVLSHYYFVTSNKLNRYYFFTVGHITVLLVKTFFSHH